MSAPYDDSRVRPDGWAYDLTHGCGWGFCTDAMETVVHLQGLHDCDLFRSTGRGLPEEEGS